MNTFAKIDRKTFLRFAAEHPEQRYELERGRIVQQMTGGTARHGVVALMIAQQFLGQVDPKQWRVSLDRGVGVAQSSRYPDVVIEPADEPLDSLETEKPIVIVEVLSPSTTGIDLNTKPAEYLAIPTLDVYVVASQTEPAFLVWQRGKNGTFPAEPVEIEGLKKKVTLTGRSFKLTVKLADVYRGIV